MWLALAAALTTGQVPDARPLSPADAVSSAAQFIAKLPQGADARYLRFLSLYNIDPKDRPLAMKVLSGHCNALSRQAKLTPVGSVEGSNNSLVWIDLRAYRWSVELWEKLAPLYFSALVEEYELVTIYPALKAGDRWPAGRPWEGKVYDKPFTVADAHPAVVEKRQRHVVQKAAPWLPEAAVNALGAATYSRNPIVRADWFVHETAVQRAKGVGYYDFLGLKKQKDYEDLIRFDAHLSRETEHLRVVVLSGILNEDSTPRRLEQINTVLGLLLRSFDAELGQDKGNALRILDKKNFEFKATEQIAPNLNGLPVFMLANDKGVLQNEAPTNIVGADWTAKGNNKALKNGLSCLTCHWAVDKEEKGLKKFKPANIEEIGSPDYDVYEELTRQYLRNAEPDRKSQRDRFEAAFKEGTGGLTGFEYANGLQRLYTGYEAPVTPERAARELGVTKDAMLKTFKAYKDLSKLDVYAPKLDPVLTLLLAGDPAPFRSWEEIYPVAQTVMNSVRFDNAVKHGKN